MQRRRTTTCPHSTSRSLSQGNISPCLLSSLQEAPTSKQQNPTHSRSMRRTNPHTVVTKLVASGAKSIRLRPTAAPTLDCGAERLHRHRLEADPTRCGIIETQLYRSAPFGTETGKTGCIIWVGELMNLTSNVYVTRNSVLTSLLPRPYQLEITHRT